MHIRPLIGFPLLHVEEPHFTGWRRILKRATDLVLTSVGLVVISPLLLAIALAVKVSDGGPVIFRQTRVGRGGEPFTMFKFRSMVIDAEARKADLMSLNEGNGALFKMSSRPAGHPAGPLPAGRSPWTSCPSCSTCSAARCRWWVLGRTWPPSSPRCRSEAVRRSLVTPGLTGLWQISGRSNLDGRGLHPPRPALRRELVAAPSTCSSC